MKNQDYEEYDQDYEKRSGSAQIQERDIGYGTSGLLSYLVYFYKPQQTRGRNCHRMNTLYHNESEWGSYLKKGRIENSAEQVWTLYQEHRSLSMINCTYKQQQ